MCELISVQVSIVNKAAYTLSKKMESLCVKMWAGKELQDAKLGLGPGHRHSESDYRHALAINLAKQSSQPNLTTLIAIHIYTRLPWKRILN